MMVKWLNSTRTVLDGHFHLLEHRIYSETARKRIYLKAGNTDLRKHYFTSTPRNRIKAQQRQTNNKSKRQQFIKKLTC